MLLAFILLLSSSLSAAASVIYKGTGDEVVISAGSDLGDITAITWKHNEDIAVEWYGGEPSAFRHFIGHTTLDKFTGALTISGLTRDHSGFYTAEINDKVIGTTELRVISPVPKPTVSMQCDAEKTYCTLTCEGNTTDTGPVTYSWQISDVLNYYKGQQVNLTKDNPEPWYRCEMKNPIGSKTSEEFPNPFSSGNQTLIIILVLSILVLLLIGLIVGIVIHRKRKGSFSLGKFFSSKNPESNDQTGSFSLVKFLRSKIPKSNDQTVKEGKGTDEENTRLLEVSCNGGETAQTHTSPVLPDTNAQTENSSKKEEETQVLIHNSETPESNHQTENSPKEEEIEVQIHISETPENKNQTENSPKEEEIEVHVHRSEIPENNNQTENSPDQVQTSEEIPESGAQTENSPKEEEVEVQIHKSETPENNNQTENSPKKEEEVEVQDHRSEIPESNTQTENSQKKEEEVEVQDHRSETSDSNNQTENSPKEEEEVEVHVHRSETPESSNQTENSPKKEEEVEVQDHRSETPENNNQTDKSAETSNGDETTRSLPEERNQSISVSA